MKCKKCRCDISVDSYTAYLLDRGKMSGLCLKCKEETERADLDSMTQDVIDKLCHAANGHANPDKMAASILRAIQRQHRYLQNEFFIVLWKLFQEYSKLDESGYDARNEWAVKVAKRWDDATFD